jgi:dTDP-4-dehydrorhamnose reductase
MTSPSVEMLILGARGQVGRALAAESNRRGLKVGALGHAECDISDPDAVTRAVGGARWVVNCAAYTAVDRAETDDETAFRINADGARNVAIACAKGAIPLVHISTDYIFDGENKTPIHELNVARPLNVYGQSKLDGELAVRAQRSSHFILRTSWVFSAHGENFVKTILRLAAGSSPLRIVDDQIGGPTAADDIAKAVLDMVSVGSKPGFDDWGTYHFSGAPPVTWFEFAQAIVEATVSGQSKQVLPIATEDFPRPARRPKNSVLDCGRIREVFGIDQPNWRISLQNVLQELVASP